MVLKLFSQSVFVLAICVVSFAFEKFFCLLFLYRKIYQSSITASEYNSLYFFRRYLLSNYFTFAFFVVSTPSTVRSVGRNRPLPQFWAAALPSRPGCGSFHSPPVSPLPTATSAVCPPQGTQSCFREAGVTSNTAQELRGRPAPRSRHGARPPAPSAPQCVVFPGLHPGPALPATCAPARPAQGEQRSHMEGIRTQGPARNWGFASAKWLARNLCRWRLLEMPSAFSWNLRIGANFLGKAVAHHPVTLDLLAMPLRGLCKLTNFAILCPESKPKNSESSIVVINSNRWWSFSITKGNVKGKKSKIWK